MGSMDWNSKAIPSSTSKDMISVTTDIISFSSIGIPRTIVSMSIVVRSLIPIMEEMRSPPFKMKFCLYPEDASRTRIRSKETHLQDFLRPQILLLCNVTYRTFQLLWCFHAMTSRYVLILVSMPKLRLYAISFPISGRDLKYSFNACE